MAESKNARRRKSVPKDQEREPLEVVVSFSAPEPPPLAAAGAKLTPPTAKNVRRSKRRPLTFRF
jgi:hypothetical protein